MTNRSSAPFTQEHLGMTIEASLSWRCFGYRQVGSSECAVDNFKYIGVFKRS